LNDATSQNDIKFIVVKRQRACVFDELKKCAGIIVMAKLNRLRHCVHADVLPFTGVRVGRKNELVMAIATAKIQQL